MIYKLFLLNIISGCVISFVFDDYSSCEFQTGKSKILLKDELWNVTNNDRTILVSLCTPIKNVPGCDSKAMACILNKDKSHQISNAGTQFEYDRTNKLLRSQFGQKCSPSQNFTTVVYFRENVKQKHIKDNDCEIHLEMLDPHFDHPCMVRIRQDVIDLRNANVTFEVRTNNRSFIISLCNFTAKRNDSKSFAWEKTADGVTIGIGTVKTQRLSYSGKHLIIRGEEGLQSTEIAIKCNWHSKIYNPRCIHCSTKKCKFEVESYLGCIKLPTSCAKRFDSNYFYNISGLYKRNGFWKINVNGNGTLLLNVCGNLDLKSAANECTSTYSQVCFINNTGHYISFGSIPTDLSIKNDILKISFTNGSPCIYNKSILYRTDIEFICSENEVGPQLDKIDCVVKIIWKTTFACPKRIFIGETCQVADNLIGMRNLSALHFNLDKIHPLQQNHFLRYNLCGPLQEPCNGFKNVSFCENVNGEESVIGWLNTTLFNNNGILKMHLSGARCHSGMPAAVNIDFNCSSSGDVKISIDRIGCDFHVIVLTQLACSSNLVNKSVINCTVKIDDDIVDLSPLSLNNRNYIIKDSNSNVEYILHVCRSVLIDSDVMCKSTSVCMKNISEPNIKSRFRSLGRLNKPELKNNEILIQQSRGYLCEQYAEYATSVIHFNCSINEEHPKLVKHTKCNYEFLWLTPHACPKKQPEILKPTVTCLRENIITGTILNLDVIQSKEVIIEAPDGKYVFNICQNSYKSCIKDNCSTINTFTQLITDSTGTYISYDLKYPCTKPTSANKCFIYLTCSSLNYEKYEIISVQNCILKVRLYTNITCNNKREVALPSIPRNFKSCLIKNNETNYEFKLNNIETFNVTSLTKINYTVELARPSELCNGYVCRNYLQIVSSESCPIPQFNYNYGYVQLEFQSRTMCSSTTLYQFEVWLKCNSDTKVPEVINESECKAVLQYPLREACLLLEKHHTGGADSAVTIGVSIVVVVLVIVLSVTGYIFRRKLPYFSKLCAYQSIPDDKSHTLIYIRDSQL